MLTASFCVEFMPAGVLEASLDTLDASTVVYDVSTLDEATLTQGQKDSIEKLKDMVLQAKADLNALDSNGAFIGPGGQLVRVSELKAFLDRTDFLITDKSYTNGSPTLPGGGAAHDNNGIPLFEVNVNALASYMSMSDDARFWYLLHELSHVTSAGVAMRDSMYTAGSDGGGTRTSAENLANEQWTNQFAAAIAQAVGHPCPAWWTPPGGYGSSVGIVYNPTHGSGGDGGGGSNDGGGDGDGSGGGGGGGDISDREQLQ